MKRRHLPQIGASDAKSLVMGQSRARALTGRLNVLPNANTSVTPGEARGMGDEREGMAWELSQEEHVAWEKQREGTWHGETPAGGARGMGSKREARVAWGAKWEGHVAWETEA
ncbi:hypothetical protein CYMTET_21548 [Cymbomonas tetramitiformis]|uniref:Uncharacterized protein n=1 Tax=Cymbomonas tetramitiformis TaxID=36881 RepID=A0AAE0L2U9_9CHLO|nr:hypothetical protein CYMTET_21548 [Cymbomonas tetramitiformis]